MSQSPSEKEKVVILLQVGTFETPAEQGHDETPLRR